MALAGLFVLSACESNNNGGSGSDDNTPNSDTKSDSAAKAGDIIRLGGHDWRIIDLQDGKVLIVSEKILENRAFHSEAVIMWEGAVTWETSEIRQYLNGSFYDNTFTAEEKERIIESAIDNPAHPSAGIEDAGNTVDKIFLLSLWEATNYFNPDSARSADSLETGAPSEWWLRTFGINAATKAPICVNDDGLLNVGGKLGSDEIGIRPALWLTMK